MRANKPLVANGIAKPRPKSTKPASPQPPTNGRRWLTLKEISSMVGCSVDHCYKLHRRGLLPSFKLPGLGIRVDKNALEATFQKQISARAATAGTSWPT